MMQGDITNGLLILLGEHVSIDENGCWLWEDGRDYGVVHITERTEDLVEVVPGVRMFARVREGAWAGMYVHRYVALVKFGSIPEGWVVRHKCDVPACCNPHHLDIGTVKDNVRDMIDRGRAAWQKNPKPPKPKQGRPVLVINGRSSV